MNAEVVRERLDYATFFGAHVKRFQKKENGQATGLCPFHDDHTASLSVNLAAGLFNCFACHATGDAFTFVAPGEETDLRAIERAVKRTLPRVTLPDFDYKARPQAKLEIPLAERIAEIRRRKGEERARSKTREAGRAGRPVPNRPRGPASGGNRPGGPASGGQRRRGR